MTAQTFGKGLIDRIGEAGLEHSGLAKDAPRARIGGARIPYRPQDLAAIITLLNQRNPVNYLALEVEAKGGLEFIGQNMGGLYLHTIIEHNKDEKTLRQHLRKLDAKFDVITIDGRGLSLPAQALWKYLEGGKEAQPREFGKGAPSDFGPPKMKPGCVLVLNLADSDTKTLYYTLRQRYTPMYSSQFVGVVHI